MFVVRRAFRNYNQMMLPGSIVEPGSIKWFKTRLKDRVIIEVNAHNLDSWDAYFVSKFGVSIKPSSVPEAPQEAKEPQESAVNEPVKVVRVVATVKKN